MKKNIVYRLPERHNTAESKSDIDLQEFANKLYVDPLYSKTEERSAVNYATLSGRWDIEDVKEENSLKIIHRASGDSIVISFDSFTDKVRFARMLYSGEPLRQIGVGFNLERYINRNILSYK